MIFVHFNPRPREEGDLYCVAHFFRQLYFNPRPREEGDFSTQAGICPLNVISIHALVKRATGKYCAREIRKDISIHALVKRATLRHIFFAWITFYFNPRPREEGDRYHVPLIHSRIISIHALVKRATLKIGVKTTKIAISIHALVKRATYKVYYIPLYNAHFNPRPREEGDLMIVLTLIVCLTISIHALVKRATHSIYHQPYLTEISIHALVKRATYLVYL